MTDPRFLPLDTVHSGNWSSLARDRTFWISSTDLGLPGGVSTSAIRLLTGILLTRQQRKVNVSYAHRKGPKNATATVPYGRDHCPRLTSKNVPLYQIGLPSSLGESILLAPRDLARTLGREPAAHHYPRIVWPFCVHFRNWSWYFPSCCCFSQKVGERDFERLGITVVTTYKSMTVSRLEDVPSASCVLVVPWYPGIFLLGEDLFGSRFSSVFSIQVYY